MTFVDFKEEAYTEQYQDSVECVLANMEEARYTLGEEITAAINYERLDADF